MGSLNDTERIIIGAALITAGVMLNYNSGLILAGVNMIISAAESTPTAELTGRDLDIRSPIAPWKIIYGKQRVGGTYAFLHETGFTNEYLNVVFIVAGHEVEAIDQLYFNGLLVPIDADESTIPPAVSVTVISEATGTDILTGATTHNYTQNFRVEVADGDKPAPLVRGEVYFIDVIDDTRFRLLDRYDGAIVDITGNSASQWTLRPSGTVEYPNYAGHVFYKIQLGSPSQTVLLTLAAEVNDVDIWGVEHKLSGRAYAWIRFKWNIDIYSQSIPNVSFDVRGKKIYDPVTTTTIYSANAAMVLVDFLTDTNYGVGIPYEEIDEPLFIAARNICDETVATVTGGTEKRYEAHGVVTSDELPGEVIKKILSAMGGQLVYASGKFNIYAAAWRTPTKSIDESDYRGKLQVQPLTSRRDNFNAVKGVYISPENNWQPSDYPSYNRTIAQTFNPADVFVAVDEIEIAGHNFTSGDELTFTSTGALPTTTPQILADTPYWVYETPSADRFSIADVRFGIVGDRIDFTTQGSGVHTVTSDPYKNLDDAERIYKEYALPFTISSSAAQRLAKILLERGRQSMTFAVDGRLATFENIPPDVIKVNSARMGWVDKEFELATGALSIDDNGSIGYNMALQETAPEIFDWTTSDEKTLDYAINTSLSNPFSNTSVVTSLVLASGTAQLFTRLDGTIFSRIKVSWTAPDDEFVLSGGRYEIQHKKNAESTWLPSTFIDGSLTETFILDVEDGVSYDVRVRTINSLEVRSSWVQSLNHTVAGKTVPPGDITTVAAAVNGETVTIVWTSISDIDLAGYIIKYTPLGSSSWDDAILIADITRTTNYTTAVLPPGDWDVLVKAVDTTGNESVNFTSDPVTVAEAQNTYRNIQHHPDWYRIEESTFVLDDAVWGLLDQSYNPITSASVLTNFVRHPSGALVPEDQTLASGNNYDVFDNYVQNPEALSTYLAPIITLPIEASLRIIASRLIEAGPGEINNPVFDIEHRIANNDENWGSWISLKDLLFTKSFRRIQFRLTTTNTINEAVVVREYSNLLDQPQVIKGAINILVPITGLAIVFDRQFLELPRVLITIADGGTKIGVHENASLTGFDAFVYDITTGLLTSGSIDWEAKNY